MLHCISIYPPDYNDINLKNIQMFQRTFKYPVGFSDHSIGTSIPLASVALGSCVIEKHFTIDKELPGWDHKISANPEELKTIVTESINISKSLGSFNRIVSKAEEGKKLKFRRSIVARRALEKGIIITADDLDIKRPGTGIPADKIYDIIGRKLVCKIDKDQLISLSMLI